MPPIARPALLAALLALSFSAPCQQPPSTQRTSTQRTSTQLPSTQRTSQQPPPSWTVTDEPDPPGTSLITVLTTSSVPSTEAALPSATLQIRCAGTRTSATISSDTAFAVKSDALTTLPVRLDSDPSLEAGWANLTLHRILIYNLRSLLLTHQRLTIGLPLGDHGLQTLTFDLSQLPTTMREHNCRRRLE